ncbi:MAG: 1-(5-phosphoribosyl)-5-[(5-phosphoribosylamino)methylideneamino]imidazole-4-carboxamide isomerase [Clostridiales bacterium]|nr:1-(5-phosphoribosyl)-5-[(5-phosphoribosylamino)methylideneamino]imidazole-4-carboxamide isomerase [Clostridiales bacterium]
MILYPAIDIKNGQCVRLRQGQFHDIEIYSHTPVKIASKWEQQGASYIHIVDLDGALVGRSINETVIREIVKAVGVPVQLGGGIRNISDIENALNYGVERVIIGTKAVEEPLFIKEAIQIFGADKIVVGVDAKNGLVAIEGWEKISTLTALNLCREMKKIGVKNIIYTDISKDGMLQGPNIESTKSLSDATDLNIIASGGVSSMTDLENLYKAEISGVIVGKALYEKRINLRKAVQLFEKGESNE